MVLPQVTAVVVTHNPQITALKSLIEAIKPQIYELIVVDNASDNAASVASLANYFHYLPQIENRGLGVAHNIGIRRSLQNGSEAVLLLDQDSLPAKSMVEQLLAARETLGSEARISALGSVYTQGRGDTRSCFVRFGKWGFRRVCCQLNQHHTHILPADFLISSGSLFTKEALLNVGLMDEGLFIDHVDTEWFLRARSLGFNCYGVCSACMQHRLGSKVYTVTIGRKRHIPQHPPFRYYYIFRNSIALYRRDYCGKLWKWNDLHRLIQIVLWFGIVVGPRRQNLRMMLRGIRDALLGRSGKMPI